MYRNVSIKSPQLLSNQRSAVNDVSGLYDIFVVNLRIIVLQLYLIEKLSRRNWFSGVHICKWKNKFAGSNESIFEVGWSYEQKFWQILSFQAHKSFLGREIEVLIIYNTAYLVFLIDWDCVWHDPFIFFVFARMIHLMIHI